MPRAVIGAPGGAVAPPSPGPPAFHRALPGYGPTRLVNSLAVAAAAGVRRVLVKDESSRFGLPAFKFLGASWAVARVLGVTAGDLEGLTNAARELGVVRLSAATDGNHGRAVARVARLGGMRATIFVPVSMREARREAIRSEGAEVIVVEGDYDETVRRAAAEERDPSCRVVNDADQDGSSPVPGWVIEGYATLFGEAEEQARTQGADPDLLIIQIGVGAFAAAGIAWAGSRGIPVVGVEPRAAACVAASLAAGHPVTIATQPTHMSGLDCGTPSAAAWPVLAAGLAGVVTVTDAEADDAACLLAADGVEAGESGAAGSAGLLALARDAECETLRRAVGLEHAATVLVINTEGATDPERYAGVIAAAPGADAPPG